MAWGSITSPAVVAEMVSCCRRGCGLAGGNREAESIDGLIVPSALSGSRRAVAKMHVLANKLDTPCGRRAADEEESDLQVCHVALVPHDEEQPPEATADSDYDDWRRRLKMWRRARITFWSSREAYRGDEEPGCRLDIMSVTRVECLPLEPLRVSIKYRDAGLLKELLLLFSSSEKACAWRDALRDARALLQYSVRHGSRYG